MSAKSPPENPEALSTFAETAKNHGERKKDTVNATEKTDGIPTDPKLKDEAARQVLRAGIEKRPEQAQPAVDALPDRTKQ